MDKCSVAKWIGVAVLLGSCVAHAAEDKESRRFFKNNSQAASQSGGCELSSTLEFGPHWKHVGLKFGDEDTVKGSIGGMSIDYTLEAEEGFYSNFAFDWSLGRITGKEKKEGEEKSSFYIHEEEVEATFGYRFNWDEENNAFFTPYIGFGFNHESQHPRHFGMKFKYDKFFIPLGILCGCDLGEDFKVELDASWSPDVSPTVRTVMPQGEFKELKWVMKNASAVSVALPIRWDIASDEACKSLLSLTPTFDWTKYGKPKSKIKSSGREHPLPLQHITEWGLGLSYACSF